MTKPKLFTALLLLLFAAGGLFAQRDSLCMRIVDEWDAPVPMEFWPKAMEVVGDYIYVTTSNMLRVFSLSDSGNITLDTALVSRDIGTVYGAIWGMAIVDTLAFVLSNPDIVVLNVANPAHPESVTTLIGLFSSSSSAKEIFAYDTVLYLTESPSAGDWDGPLKRINIRDPFDIYEIPTSSTGVPYIFQFPYLYGIGIGSATSIGAADLRQADSVTIKVASISGINWYERDPKGLAVRDSFVFVPCMLSYVRSFMTNSTFDTLIYLDEYREPWYEGDGGGFLVSYRLLFVSWDNLIRVFNTVNPGDIRKIGEYRFDRPLYYGYYDFAYIDSFLVATFYNGVVIFKFPCTGCDGNCELDILPEQLDFDVSPNPFNSRCEIKYSFPTPRGGTLTIHDITGRMVIEENLRDNAGVYNWDARGQASGIYLAVLHTEEATMSKKIFFVK